MKKIFNTLLLFIFVLVPVCSSAAPVYLTLEGTIGSVVDGANLASKAGVKVGDLVNYVVKIDSDLTGTYTWKNGKVYEQPGTIFSSLETGILDGKRFDQRNYGSDYGSMMSFISGNENSNLFMNDWSDGLGDLQIGSRIDQLYEIGWKSAVHYTRLDLNDVTVTRIAETAPTPIPGAVLLMGGGLGVVAFIRRRFVGR